MTGATDVLREFTDCPYADAVSGVNHSGCSWCAKIEEAGIDAALADLDALVQAAERFSGRLDAPEYLRDALARVKGDAA